VSRVAQSVYCLTTGWTTGRSGFDPRQRREDFSYSLCVQTGSGNHLASCPMGTGGPFSGAKARPGRDADYYPPSSTDVENEELYFLSTHAPTWRVVEQLFSFARCRCMHYPVYIFPRFMRSYIRLCAVLCV
jgi:hypothetical protein